MNPIFAFVGLIILAVLTVTVSSQILLRGRFYHWLKPENRPRRWVLLSLLSLFGVFLLWFIVWSLWPHTLIARALTLLFGLTFFSVGMALKWFTPLIDRAITRRGKQLR